MNQTFFHYSNEQNNIKTKPVKTLKEGDEKEIRTLNVESHKKGLIEDSVISIDDEDYQEFNDEEIKKFTLYATNKNLEDRESSIACKTITTNLRDLKPTDAVVSKHKDTVLKVENYLRLLDDRFLASEEITAFTRNLIKKYNSTLVFLDTYTAELIYKGEINQDRLYRKKTQKLDLSSGFISFINNSDNHWRMCVFLQKENKVIYLDPKFKESERAEASQFKTNLLKYLKRRDAKLPTQKKLKIKNLQIQCPSHTKQTRMDGRNCGIYCLMVGLKIFR